MTKEMIKQWKREQKQEVRTCAYGRCNCDRSDRLLLQAKRAKELEKQRKRDARAAKKQAVAAAKAAKVLKRQMQLDRKRDYPDSLEARNAVSRMVAARQRLEEDLAVRQFSLAVR